jgi:hypothetical protein
VSLDALRNVQVFAVDPDAGPAARGALLLVYHEAVTGPSAAKRAVFGMKGALEEDFGRRVPALLVFEGDRYPAEVFPRMDRELNRVVGLEEALRRMLAT